MIMTTTEQPTLATSDVDPAHRCTICNHNLAGHDAISLRYCQATQANALSRNCVCPSTN